MTNDTRTTKSGRRDEQVAFEANADAFGGDMQRWPEADRSAYETMPARNALARRQLAEARALDEVLARGAPEPDRRSLARLEDLILAAAVSESAAAHSSGGNVVPMRSAAPEKVRPATGAAARPPSVSNWRQKSDWRAAALLAASLFTGVFIGISEPGQTTVGTVIAAVEQQPRWDGNDIVAAIQSETFDLEDAP